MVGLLVLHTSVILAGEVDVGWGRGGLEVLEWRVLVVQWVGRREDAWGQDAVVGWVRLVAHVRGHPGLVHLSGHVVGGGTELDDVVVDGGGGGEAAVLLVKGRLDGGGDERWLHSTRCG